jgi:phage baseplate assembly protein W
MTLMEDIDRIGAEVVAEYQAGGYEPDGVGLALGTTVENTPAALGWGRDLSCVDDCDEHFTEVDPMSPQAVGESIERLLSTTHGKLIADEELLLAVGEDPDYGYNLHQLLHVGVTPLQIRAHADLAAAAIKDNDDRVASATVSITQRGNGNTFDVVIDATLINGVAFSRIMTIHAAADELRTVAQ